MVDSSLPFAQALLSLAADAHKEDEYARFLNEIVKTIDENRDLADYLALPAISREAKEQMLLQVFGDIDDKTFSDFLKIVCRYSMASRLKQIAADYDRLLDDARDIQNVTVTSAAPLSSSQSERLKEALEKRLGSQVRLHEKVDPALIAGLTIQTEDRTMDASVLGRIDRMKEQLSRS